MTSWKQALLLGALMWLIPFAVAVAAFPFHEPARPLFESIMAVTVAAAASLLGLRYVRRGVGPREGLALGVLWLAISLVIDAPLMLFGGPMHMTLSAYLADIGLTYLMIPTITWSLAAAQRRPT